MRVAYVAEAEKEMAAAAEYLARAASSVETGHRFLADIAAAEELILQFPHASPPLGAGLRRCLLSRFPYQIVYRVEGDTIRVYAVAHNKRRPGYWRRRVRS